MTKGTTLAGRARGLSSESERSALSASSDALSAGAVRSHADNANNGSATSSSGRAGSLPVSIDSPPPLSPVHVLRTYDKKMDSSSSPPSGANKSNSATRRSPFGTRKKLSLGTGRGRSLSFGSAASSSPEAVKTTERSAADPSLVPPPPFSASDQTRGPEEDAPSAPDDSPVATSSAGKRSPTRTGSKNHHLRRTCSTTAQRTAMIREAGVENNVRRLVEYFVVVSSTRRRQTRRRRDSAGQPQPSLPAGNGGSEHVEQHDDKSCPPSPATTPTSKTILRKTATVAGPSPKVQQRMNFRRVHLLGGGDCDTIGNDEETSTLRPPDLESAAGEISSSPTGMERKKLLRPISTRLFKGNVRSCAAAMEEGSTKLRLPVLDQVGSDDSDCDDDRLNEDQASSSLTERAGSDVAFLDDISPLPNVDDSSEVGNSASKRPPIHPSPSQKARWIREGGASNNIRMPGHGNDDSGLDGEVGGGVGGKSDTVAAGSDHHGAELSFEPQVSSRFPLEDYPNTKLDETAVAQFCNPSSDFIELTTEYQMPKVHHFVLTNEKGRKIYGTCLTIYEEYEPPHDGEDLLPEEREILNWYRSHAGTVQYANGDSDGDGDGVEVALHRNGGRATLYLPRMLCLLSTWPYLTAFREYLTQLYRLATTTDQMTAPLERYILNICKEVPAPPPGAFEVRMDILNSAIRFWAPPANQVS